MLSHILTITWVLYSKRTGDIQIRKLGPERVDVARISNTLGYLQLTLGDLQQTKENYEPTLHI